MATKHQSKMTVEQKIRQHYAGKNERTNIILIQDDTYDDTSAIDIMLCMAQWLITHDSPTLVSHNHNVNSDFDTSNKQTA